MQEKVISYFCFVKGHRFYTFLNSIEMYWHRNLSSCIQAFLTLHNLSKSGVIDPSILVIFFLFSLNSSLIFYFWVLIFRTIFTQFVQIICYTNLITMLSYTSILNFKNNNKLFNLRFRKLFLFKYLPYQRSVYSLIFIFHQILYFTVLH